MKVAVITNSKKVFLEYVRENQDPNIQYFFISSYNNALGTQSFNKIVKLYGHQQVRNLDDILEYLNKRLVEEKVVYKLGFWNWLHLILVFPLWFFYRSPSKKNWEEFKAGLIKHEHKWNYNEPVYEKGHKHYPCKHLGCNYITVYEPDGSLCR